MPFKPCSQGALRRGSTDVDLLIRTGGEKRLSDFLLWEVAYDELLFSDRIGRGPRPLRVRLIVPALKEATDPQWRSIKYALFPPLGLATLAAYLPPDDDAVLVDEHVEPLRLDDAPDVVVIQVYITNAYRAYKIADHYRRKGAFVCLGGLHVTSLPEEAAPHADAIFLGSGE